MYFSRLRVKFAIQETNKVFYFVQFLLQSFQAGRKKASAKHSLPANFLLKCIYNNFN